MRVLSRIVSLAMLPAALAAQGKIPTPAQQITLAVLPLPQEFRGGATVLGYDAKGSLITLRRGTGGMICVANDNKQSNFRVACYPKSIDPYMARGRELRAKGITDAAVVDTTRLAEIKSGKLVMPTLPAAVWSITAPLTDVDVVKGTIAARNKASYEVYMPGATAATTGLPEAAVPGAPYIMYPGTARAHVMFPGSM